MKRSLSGYGHPGGEYEMKKLLTLLALMSLLLTFVVGCGGGDEDQGNGEEPTVDSPEGEGTDEGGEEAGEEMGEDGDAEEAHEEGDEDAGSDEGSEEGGEEEGH